MIHCDRCEQVTLRTTASSASSSSSAVSCREAASNQELAECPGIPLQKLAQPDLIKASRVPIVETSAGNGYSIPNLCSSDCEGVVIICPHRALCPVVNRGDDCLDSLSRGVAIEYFPDLDNTVSLPPPL